MMRGSRPRALVSFLLAGLVLAACSGTSHRPSASKPKAATVRIGVIYTTSGQGGDLAGAVLGAVKLAADEAATRSVTVTTEPLDYAGDLAKVRAGAAALARKVDAVIVGTDDGDITGELSGLGSTPILHPFVTKDSAVTVSGSTFRLGPSNRLLAQRIATFLTANRRYTRISVISDTTAFGREGQADISAALAERHVSPLGLYEFAPGGDVHTPVSAIAQRGAQACVIWVESPGEAARIVVDVHKSKFAYQLALSGNLATPAFAKNATSQVSPVAFRDGILSAGPWAGPWFRLQRIVRFYRDFKSANSAVPPVQAAAVYDGVLALASIAQTRGTSANAITQGLESLKDFEGAGVPLTFGSGKHEGLDLDDVAVYGFTKNQDAPGGDMAADVSTGGGFFTVLDSSLELPERYAFLAPRTRSSQEPRP